MTCEAVEVGKKAKAYRTLLTHFSQRYPKIPIIDPSFQDSTCIGFDLMTINLAGEPQDLCSSEVIYEKDDVPCHMSHRIFIPLLLYSLNTQ